MDSYARNHIHVRWRYLITVLLYSLTDKHAQTSWWSSSRLLLKWQMTQSLRSSWASAPSDGRKETPQKKKTNISTQLPQSNIDGQMTAASHMWFLKALFSCKNYYCLLNWTYLEFRLQGWLSKRGLLCLDWQKDRRGIGSGGRREKKRRSSKTSEERSIRPVSESTSFKLNILDFRDKTKNNLIT